MNYQSTRTHTIFPDRASPQGEPLRDLAIITAYDKTARLNIPVFKTGNKDRTLQFREDVEKACFATPDGLKGTENPLAKVALAVSKVMSASRYEPENGLTIHRRYPSPRALFPIQIDFVLSQPEAEMRFRHEPDYNAFYQPCEDAEMNAAIPANLRIELVAVLPRITPLYGNLAPTLCALEAGHLVRQLSDELREAGFNFEILVAEAPTQDAPCSGQAPAFELPVLEIRIDRKISVCPAKNEFVVPIRVTRVKLGKEDINIIRETIDQLKCTPLPKRELRLSNKGKKSAPGFSHERRKPLRSSGLFPNGIHGQFTTPEETEILVEAILADFGQFAGANKDFHPTLTLLCPQSNADVAVVCPTENGICRSIVAQGCISLAQAYGSAYNIDLQTIPIIMVLSAPLARMLVDKSAWVYMQMLAAAGFVAQGICNEAATRGYFARPMKGVIEQKVESTFRLNGQILYTILIGKGRAANPFTSLASFAHET